MASFHIHTFGCQMNVRDSQWLREALILRGITESDKAEVVVLNTCSVRERPEKKIMAAALRIARTQPQVRLIAILGCVAQQLGAELFTVAPQVRLVANGDNLPLVPDAIWQLLHDPGERLALLETASAYPERPPLATHCPSRTALVNIMQGCDNFCAYCIVPYTRGRLKFRSERDILAECRMWLEAGAIEITLLGQNVNIWPGGFGALLRSVAALPGLQRLRFISPHPAFMDESVIQCVADLPNLCPRIHLPLQAGSDRILYLMGRRHTASDYLRLLDALRAARPDIALSTDLIVGFPGETESDFQATLELVSQCGFMSAFSFCYSDRPGTRAAMMPDKIPQPVKVERLQRLQVLLDHLSSQWLEAQVGRHAQVLLEGPSARQPSESWQGRDPYGACINVATRHGAQGLVVDARIVGAKKHSLWAEAAH